MKSLLVSYGRDLTGWGLNNRAKASQAAWAVCGLLALLLVTVACSSSRATPANSQTSTTSTVAENEIVPRFLVGGWVLPEDEEADPFVDTLRAFILTSEDEIRELLDGVDFLRLRGSLDSLHKADLDQVIVVAVYHMWRPLKGDPLSIANVFLNDTEVEVNLELEADPQGREFPYLVAPLYIAAIQKKDLPKEGPLNFLFKVNGEEAVTRTLNLP